jgi:glycerate 2-kinase
MKQIAQRVFRNTLSAIDISSTLARKMQRDGSRIYSGTSEVDLRQFDEIAAIAFGKAAYAMAEGLSSILEPDFRPEGILVTPSAVQRPPAGWKTFVGGHPIPTAESFAAGRAILERLARCDERTLVFFLISGGGSAMVEQALHPSIPLADFQQVHYALVTCGAPIEEINVVRKHLSATKGGRLAATCSSSMKLTFAISDVPQGEESALASGPTLPDPSTLADMDRILTEFKLLPKLPGSMRSLIEKGRLGETPKDGDACFKRAQFELLLGEHDLMHAAHHCCEAEGFISMVDTETDSWPLEKAKDHLLKELESLKQQYPGKRVAIFAGGELNSPVTGDGVGGRNSAFVLACVPQIAGKNIAVFSAGTDGIDGNSPAAGAVADGETLARARHLGMEPSDFFGRCDAFGFFSRLEDAVTSGPTGNNLRDLRILLAE